MLTWDLEGGHVSEMGALSAAQAQGFERAVVTSDKQWVVATQRQELTVWHLDSLNRVATVPHGASGQARASLGRPLNGQVRRLGAGEVV